MTRTKFDYPWTLAEALVLIQAIEPAFKEAGWYPALAGSVLTRGCSSKDLDLIFYPATTEFAHPAPVWRTLRETGFKPVVEMETVHKQWRRLGSKDEKHCSIWSHEGRRVDIFILK